MQQGELSDIGASRFKPRNTNRGWGKPAQPLAIGAQGEAVRVTAMQLSIVSAPVPPEGPARMNGVEIIDGEVLNPETINGDATPRIIDIATVRPDEPGDE